MKKIIRLTESDLLNLVKRVIKEQGQTFPMDGKPHSVGPGMLKNTSGTSKEYNMIDTCASMGVKSPGYCDTQGKKPVKSCAALGVKTPGNCYVDTKKPIPNQSPNLGMVVN